MSDPNANGDPNANPVVPVVQNPPNNPLHLTVPDDHPLKVALSNKSAQVEQLRQQNEQLTSQFTELKSQFGMIQGALGNVDPTSLSQIQEAVRAQSEMDSRLAAAAEAARKETEQKYTTSVEQLTTNLNQSQTQFKQFTQDRALQQLFVECGGRDYANFKALLGVQYRAVFTDGDSPQVQQIVDSQGHPVTDNDGKPLAPKDVLMALRSGKLSESAGIFKTTFLPMNASTGHGYIPGLGQPGVDTPNPFLASNFHMGQIATLYKQNKAEAKRLAMESNNPKAIAMAKTW